MISTHQYTPNSTLQAPALLFLGRLLGSEVEDISPSLLLALYGPQVQALIEPTRVKRAVYQRLVKPYVTALETGQPQDGLYHRCSQLGLSESSGEKNTFLCHLFDYLNRDQFGLYHTASHALRGKILRDHPKSMMYPATLEIGFNAARLLSRIDDLATITEVIGEPYTPAVHAWGVETFDVAYELLRPGTANRFAHAD